MSLSKKIKVFIVASSVIVVGAAIGLGVGLGVDFSSSDSTTGLTPITREEGEKFYDGLSDLPKEKRTEEIIKRTPDLMTFCDKFESTSPTQAEADERMNEYLRNYQVINDNLKLADQISVFCWRVRETRGTENQLALTEVDQYVKDIQRITIESKEEIANGASNTEVQEKLKTTLYKYFLDNKLTCQSEEITEDTDKANGVKNEIKDFLLDSPGEELKKYEPVGYPITKRFSHDKNPENEALEYCFKLKIKSS